MKLRGNRNAERAAVNAARSFFEANDFVFQEVDSDNDYGKDAYVDLTEGTTITGFMLALQIKGGVSFRRPDGYGIPLDSRHKTVWRESTAPVGGIVQDPADGLLRWCNISQYLDEHSKETGSYIPVPKHQILTRDSLQEFKASFKRFWDRQAGGKSILRLCGADELEQMGALYDCFAFGRRDARVLIVLRYMLKMLPLTATRQALRILSHTTAHGDIFWHKENWIPEDTCKQVAVHFRWTVEELLHLFSIVPWPEWHRGGLGESLYMLVVNDPDIKLKMEKVAVAALDTATDDEDNLMYGPFYLTIYWVEENGKAKYYELLARDHRFHEFSSILELESIFERGDRVLMFEIA